MEFKRLKLVGVTFNERQKLLMELENCPNSHLVLRAEPYNPYDPNAVGCYNEKQQCIGYISANIAKDMDITEEIPITDYVILGGGQYNYGIIVEFPLLT